MKLVTNPVPARVPQAFAKDRDLFAYFTELHTILRAMSKTVYAGDIMADKSLALNDKIVGITSATADTLFFSDTGSTKINLVTCYNSDAAPVLVSFYITPFGTTPVATVPVAVQTIANGASAVIVGLTNHVIPKGGGFFAFAGATSVISVTASGSAL